MKAHPTKHRPGCLWRRRDSCSAASQLTLQDVPDNFDGAASHVQNLMDSLTNLVGDRKEKNVTCGTKPRTTRSFPPEARAETPSSAEPHPEHPHRNTGRQVAAAQRPQSRLAPPPPARDAPSREAALARLRKSPAAGSAFLRPSQGRSAPTALRSRTHRPFPPHTRPRSRQSA